MKLRVVVLAIVAFWSTSAEAADPAKRPPAKHKVEKCFQISGDHAIIKINGVCDANIDYDSFAPTGDFYVRPEGGEPTSGPTPLAAKRCALKIQQCKSYECMYKAFGEFFHCLGIK
jgi:hypothetical protein